MVERRNEYRRIAVSLALFACVTGCCVELEPVTPETLPTVREATIAVFNNGFNGGTPVPEFNLATFRFPSSEQTSGSLPNDNRFALGPWQFREENYPVRGATTLYSFSTPPNAMLAGDILVEDITLQPVPRARIRVRGRYLGLPPNPRIRTDNARVIAEEVRQVALQGVGQISCRELESRAFQFGAPLPIQIPAAVSIVVEENGQPSAIQYPVTWPRDEQGRLLPVIRQPVTFDIGYYAVDVTLGDWFYYKAANGMPFIGVVTNIQAGTLPPFVRRLTIKFAELYGCHDC